MFVRACGMEKRAAFLVVNGRAIADIDAICREKTAVCWDTIGAIVIDRQFLEMTVAEMADPSVRWQVAIDAVLAKTERRMARVPNREIAEIAIELKGACRFLFDHDGSQATR